MLTTPKNLIIAILCASMILLGLTLPTRANRGVEVPQEVLECLEELQEAFMENEPNRATIARYLNEERALRRIRVPITDRNIEALYESVERFIARVREEAGERVNTHTQIIIIRYTVRSPESDAFSRRVISGRVGDPADYHNMERFDIVLPGTTDCETSDIGIPGLLGLTDGVPRN